MLIGPMLAFGAIGYWLDVGSARSRGSF